MEKVSRISTRRLGVAVAAIVGALTVSLVAAQAVAAIPHSSTGVVTSCYNSNGSLRVVDTERGGTCGADETQLSWNATAISATQWSSTAVRPLSRTGGVPTVALLQTGSKLPAGSWSLTAVVMIANGVGAVDSFRCYLQAGTTAAFINGQVQEWGGAEWHRTMTIPALVTLVQPDWIDVYCSHAQTPPPQNGGPLQVESVQVFAQRVAATF